MKKVVLSILFLISSLSFSENLTAGQYARIQKATSSATNALLGAFYSTDRFGNRVVSQDLVKQTYCVVAMQIVRGAYLLGGEGGEGAMSCRLGNGWSAPSYVRTGGFELSAAIGFDVMNVTLFITDPNLANRYKNQLNFDTKAYASAVAANANAALTAAGRFGMAVIQTNQTGLFAGVGISLTSMSHMQAERNQFVYGSLFGSATPVDSYGRLCSTYLIPARRHACIREFVYKTGATNINPVTAWQILSLPSYKAPQVTQTFVEVVENLLR